VEYAFRMQWKGDRPWEGSTARSQRVTGGASGIGEATVRRFVAEGASVAFCDRDNERGQRVAAELEAAGAKVAFTHADVGTEAACLAFVNGAAQKFGRLDILVNNAGIRKYEKVDEASAASWNEILNINLMSYAFCAKAAVPLMRRGNGAPPGERSSTSPRFVPSSQAAATCCTTPPRPRSRASRGGWPRTTRRRAFV